MNTTKISKPLETSLAHLAEQGLPAVNARLEQIPQEWSASRITKTVTGLMILGGALLGMLNSWFLLLALAGGVLLIQHLFSRCGLLAKCFHSLGYRTGAEIQEEMMALKVLRGDFKDVPTIDQIEDRHALSVLEGEGGPALETEPTRINSQEAIKEVVQATRA